jgi:hypothetical protein
MTRLTLFTLPKGFVEPHIAMIQRNALESWRQLGPDVEVLLMGDDPGVAEAAAEFGMTHVGSPATSEYGTPLLDWAYAQAAAHGSGESLCYVNADIILLEDFLTAVRRLPVRDHLAIGQRWDCDIRDPLGASSFDSSLGDWARNNGTLDLGRGSDYFVYPRHLDLGLPSFAVGRPGWDNWLIGRALQLRIPLIDMTPSVTVVHQNHDYRHVPQQRGSDWEGPEAEHNRVLAGHLDQYMHTPANVTHVLGPGGLRRARGVRHLRARVEEFVALHPAARPLRRLIRMARASG